MTPEEVRARQAGNYFDLEAQFLSALDAWEADRVRLTRLEEAARRVDRFFTSKAIWCPSCRQSWGAHVAPCVILGLRAALADPIEQASDA